MQQRDRVVLVSCPLQRVLMGFYPLSRWLRSRQLLTDSGYGLGDKTLYPPFSLERLSDSAFCLAVEMPCAPEPLVDIHLEG
ncbi:MAG: hypothetical protein AB7U41_05295, partial [Dongiaceae bacterium]